MDTEKNRKPYQKIMGRVKIMRKRDVDKFPPGSPEYVVAHAKWRRSRGRNMPSMRYSGSSNPKQSLETAEEIARVNKYLRAPMLQCLARVMGEIDGELRTWNKFVEFATGKKLEMELVHTHRLSDEEWLLKVRGNSHTGKPNETEFKIVWWNHTCAANFHLFQWKRIWMGGMDYVYSGVIKTNPTLIAQELAIFTHGMQIPKILSRV